MCPDGLIPLRLGGAGKGPFVCSQAPIGSLGPWFSPCGSQEDRDPRAREVGGGDRLSSGLRERLHQAVVPWRIPRTQHHDLRGPQELLPFEPPPRITKYIFKFDFSTALV